MTLSLQDRLDRTGYITGSCIHAVLAKGRNGEESKTRMAYMDALIAERLTGIPQESTFSDEYTDWGTETEPLAIAAYEERTGVKVLECGSIPHPSIDWLSATPDGLIGAEGCVEIKCMKSDNHLRYFNAKPKGAHSLQIHVEMMVTETFFADYVLYDPTQAPEWQLSIQRIKRDPAIVARIVAGVRLFIKELDDKMAE